MPSLNHEILSTLFFNEDLKLAIFFGRQLIIEAIDGVS